MKLDWRSNSIRLVSLLLAFVLWVYVSSEQNPVRENIVNVSLEHSGPAQNYLLTGGLPESVRVRVQGNRSQLANLTPGDFYAVVNIPEGKTGELALPVHVTPPAGMRVVQVTPEEVRLTVDRIVEREITVSISMRGAPALGFTALAPVCHPGVVTARGPERVINNMDRATAVVDIQAAAKDVEQAVQVSSGFPEVSLNPTSVQVVVPIVNMVASKTVPILPQLSGNPAVGFTVRRSTADPGSVQVFGPAEALSVLANVKTEVIDIQGADKNVSKEAGLVSPQGVTSIQPGRVKVQVEVSKSETVSRPSTVENSVETSRQRP